MVRFGPDMRAMRAWTEFSMAYGRMLMQAGEVIAHRTQQMAMGTMSQPEAARMVMEKMTAAAASVEKATTAAARGANPAAIATAALGPYGTKTRANARRLRK